MCSNPFDLRGDDDGGEVEGGGGGGGGAGTGAGDDKGMVCAETDAFDSLPPAQRLSVPPGLGSIDWTAASPSSFIYRGSTKTLPRFAPSSAARSFPAYYQMAQRQLDPMTKQQLIAKGAPAVAKLLRPLSAAFSAQAFCAYQHGLLSRAQLCSKKPKDIYDVMCVLGSAGFSRQHIKDTEAAAAAAGLSENTLGQHWCVRVRCCCCCCCCCCYC